MSSNESIKSLHFGNNKYGAATSAHKWKPLHKLWFTKEICTKEDKKYRIDVSEMVIAFNVIVNLKIK